MKRRHFEFKDVAITICLTACFQSYHLQAQARPKLTVVEVVKYAIDKPGQVNAGEAFSIGVVLNVTSPWYVYAPTGVNAEQGMIETKVVFGAPAGISRVGKMQLPEVSIHDGYEVYSGKEIKMIQDFKAAESLKSGIYEIKGKLTYQSCNGNVCLPPVTEDIVAQVQVK